LIYYQTNYGLIALPVLLLVGYLRPMALLFGLLVIAALLAGFAYSTRHPSALQAVSHNRPIVMLVIILVTAFMIIRMFGTIFAFLFGIALPLALIVIHATARTQTLQNKAANAVESLALQATPMGLFLGWLGARESKATDQKPTKGK